MNQNKLVGTNKNILVQFAAFVICIAGLKAASSIVVPFLLAIFVSILFSTPYFWLKARRVPSSLALIITIMIVLIIGILLGSIVDIAVTNFSRTMPLYKAQFNDQFSGLVMWFKSFGINVPDETIVQFFDPQNLLIMIGNLLRGLGGVLGNTALIMVIVIFMLLETGSLRRKIALITKNDEEEIAPYREFLLKTKKYLGIKSIISLALGIIIAVWLIILDVDYPMLWGLLAFLLNFVPTIGSFIAAIPAVFLAFIQIGVPGALFAALGYLVVNFIIGSFVEPKFLGDEVGLSTLVVILSLIFWGWVFGPIGMLLSIPLTMTAKIAFDHNEDTRWLGTLLGSAVQKEN